MDLTFATWDHDRVSALHDGRLSVPGVALESVVAPTSKLFPLAVTEAKYDITEMSISSYILQLSRGGSEYIALPAFVSRAFRHAGYFARQGSGITTLADFAGRRIGVPEYQMTAALWMRGIMQDEYGVSCDAIHWRTGALDEGVRVERLELALPKSMRVEPITAGQTLEDLLLDGQIDGLLAPKPPKAFLAGDPRLVRLFPDYEQAEEDYHKKTGFFPIMHVIGVRKSLCEKYPWLAKAVYEALVMSRDMAVARLRDIWLGNANRLTLPWLGASIERSIRVLGPDYWSYGYERNLTELEAVCRYSMQQHLSARQVAPSELFHPSVMGG